MGERGTSEKGGGGVILGISGVIDWSLRNDTEARE